jgi:hypothetical protein
MSQNKTPAQRKFWLQILAFCLVMLPPIGLYFSVTLGAAWATWGLMGLIAVGMILAMRVA